MNTDINDASIPICNVSMSAMSVRWRHGNTLRLSVLWPASLAQQYHLAVSGLTVRLPVWPWQQVCVKRVRKWGVRATWIFIMTSPVYWLQRGGHTQVRLFGPPESTVNWPGRRREEGDSKHIAHIRVIQVLPVADNWIDEDEQYRPASSVIRHVTYYDAKLFECWPDVGPALKHHWVNASCLLGCAPVINSRSNTATLTNCWASVVGGVPALKQRWLHMIVQRNACLPVWSVCPIGIHNNTQLTQGESMLVQRVSTIYDVGPTLSQRWFNVLSLLACQYTCRPMGPI